MRWAPILIAGDLAFILLHLAYRTAVISGFAERMPRYLSITHDRTLPEIYTYLKWAFICGVLVWAFRRTRVPLFLAFAGAFLVIFADDGLQLHETFGTAIARLTGRTDFGILRMQDIGELGVWAMLGTVVASFIAIGFRLSAAKDRHLGLPFLYAFFGLLFFAVGVDMIHSAVSWFHVRVLDMAFGMIEDGGEMIVASVACAYAIALATALGPPAGDGRTRGLATD